MLEKRMTLINKYALIVLLVLFAIMLGMLAFKDNSESTSFRFSERNYEDSVLSDWTFENRSVNMPLKLLGKQVGDWVSVSTTLPKSIPSKSSIVYSSSYFISKIYVDGVLIGSYGEDADNYFKSNVGKVFLLYELPEGSEGKELRIDYKIVYHAKITLPKVFCISEEGMMLALAIDNQADILFCIVFSTVALMLLVIGIVRYNKFKDRKRLSLFLNFAIFVFIIALWVFSNSDYPQFYFESNHLYAMFRHILLACVGIPYINVCKAFLHKGQRLLSALKMFNIATTIFTISVYLLGIIAPPDSLALAHFTDLVIGGVVLVIAILEWRNYKESRMLLHGMALFIVAALLGMHLYYRYPTEKYAMIVSSIGLLLFIISLFLLILKQELRYYEENMAVDIYMDMAYNDKLTGCGNRAALERLLDGFTDGENIVFIMADVNRLKYVNDNFGHDAGDELILNAANCLKRAIDVLKLNDNAEVFRLGGDEFAIIVWGKTFVVGSVYEAIDNCLNIHNLKSEHELSIAKGYAETVWNRATSGFADLYRAADMMMYADKELAHRRYNPN